MCFTFQFECQGTSPTPRSLCYLLLPNSDSVRVSPRSFQTENPRFPQGLQIHSYFSSKLFAMSDHHGHPTLLLYN